MPDTTVKANIHKSWDDGLWAVVLWDRRWRCEVFGGFDSWQGAVDALEWLWVHPPEEGQCAWGV